MSPFAHASIGVFTRPIAPKAPLLVLILATQVPDILFYAFEAAGIEQQAETQVSFSQGLVYLRLASSLSRLPPDLSSASCWRPV